MSYITNKLLLTALQIFRGLCSCYRTLFKKCFCFFNLHDERGKLDLDLEDEIISGALFSHEGKITHVPTKELLDKKINMDINILTVFILQYLLELKL